MVKNLGRFPLPVEVIPFGSELTKRHLEGLGCSATLRQSSGEGFITDNGNFIFDCDFRIISDVEVLDRKIKMVPGVVEHGLFQNAMVSKLLVGFQNGQITIHQVRL
jgi:ribose 5-phosphate isomerase A